jgi:uncharacterized phiE125 gp8 family phage protein
VTLHCLSIDRQALPAAMLGTAKAHARVDHARDDTLISQYLAQAIDEVERHCSINVNPASYEVALDTLTAPCTWPAPNAWRVRLPVNNVEGFTLFDAGGVDLSDQVTIEQADIGGAYPAYLVGTGALAAGCTLALDVGVAFIVPGTTPAPDVLPMAPSIAAAVLRLTAAYYENREASVALVLEQFAPELVSIWNPSA